jgi:hypothetical protein
MRRLVALALSVLLAMSFTACGSDDEPDTADDTRATTTAATEPSDGTSTTTAAVDETEAEILVAVDGYWDSYFVVNDPPNPDHPDLATYRTGEALEQSKANVQERKDLGQVVRLPDEPEYMHDPRVESVDGDVAVVRDCSVDDSLLVEVGTGQVLNDDVATVLWETHVAREGGEWKVSANYVTQEWEGVAGCAVE